MGVRIEKEWLVRRAKKDSLISYSSNKNLGNLVIPIMLHPNQNHHVIYKNLMRLWLKLQAAERILKLSSLTWIIFQEMVKFS